jgi:hypothetical protein
MTGQKSQKRFPSMAGRLVPCGGSVKRDGYHILPSGDREKGLSPHSRATGRVQIWVTECLRIAGIGCGRQEYRSQGTGVTVLGYGDEMPRLRGIGEQIFPPTKV